MYAQAQVKARRRPDSGEVRNPGISYVAGAASGGTFAMPSLGHGRQGVGRINWLSQPAGKCAHKTPTQSDRKLGNERVKDSFDLLPLGEVGVPLILFFQRGLLTQCGEGDLAPPVFAYLSQNLVDLEARFFDRLL